MPPMDLAFSVELEMKKEEMRLLFGFSLINELGIDAAIEVPAREHVFGFGKRLVVDDAADGFRQEVCEGKDRDEGKLLEPFVEGNRIGHDDFVE